MQPQKKPKKILEILTESKNPPILALKNINVRLYIGGDTRGHINLKQILNIISQNHQGFTFYRAIGCWQGKLENCIIVEVSDQKDSIFQTIKQIKSKLSQDAVGLVRQPAMLIL